MQLVERNILLFLGVFSIFMGVLIYWREVYDGYSLSLGGVLLWQGAIWMVWYPMFKGMAYVSLKLDRNETHKNKYIIAVLSVTFLSAHYGYYFLLSDALSPLNPFPKTVYGVYPYFFIFYVMIDIILIWSLWARLGTFKILEDKPSTELEDIITVKKGSNNILVRPEEILWVAAEDYYARIHIKADSFLIREPLKVLIDRLPQDDFVQIHRSTLVHKGFVESYSPQAVTLKNGESRRASKAGLKRLQEKFEARPSSGV
ncbi:LytTR family DNA-binding domain-containing protein [Temperatibacter marinus]|uniref:LytTR family DNA-binding domain-containing protein n=1 Tax=Temperatibacter marinus TaxID=1456591 RepID=A0AA52EBR4_9PROT|nr:LytTR family DNA-binding domain-containing protein [Temperatibacter marinus]WND01800.1 LytTR family DNA-binding domain-containing protein [Temperatibacter marinus]